MRIGVTVRRFQSHGELPTLASKGLQSRIFQIKRRALSAAGIASVKTAPIPRQQKTRRQGHRLIVQVGRIYIKAKA